MQVSAVIVAAGKGLRFGGDLPKQFLPLKGKPVLAHAVAVFEAHQQIENVIIVGAEDWLSYIVGDIVEKYGFQKVCSVVSGGKERQDSVLAGLNAIPGTPELVLIHDGARPLVEPAIIDRVIAALAAFDAAIPGVPVTDTIKKVDGDQVEETVPREPLRAVQTPQGFHLKSLKQALERARKAQILVTDEAMLIEQFGGTVACVEGNYQNIKITNALDLKIAELLLEE